MNKFTSIKVLAALGLATIASTVHAQSAPTYIDDFTLADGINSNLEYAQYGINRSVCSDILANLSPLTENSTTGMIDGLDSRIIWTRCINGTIPDPQSTCSVNILNNQSTSLDGFTANNGASPKKANSIQFLLSGKGTYSSLNYYNYLMKFNGEEYGVNYINATPGFTAYPTTFDQTTSYQTFVDGNGNLLKKDLSNYYMVFRVTNLRYADSSGNILGYSGITNPVNVNFAFQCIGNGVAGYNFSVQPTLDSTGNFTLQWYAIPLSSFYRRTGNLITYPGNTKYPNVAAAYLAGAATWAQVFYPNADYIFRWDSIYHTAVTVTDTLANSSGRLNDTTIDFEYAGQNFSTGANLPAGTIILTKDESSL